MAGVEVRSVFKLAEQAYSRLGEGAGPAWFHACFHSCLESQTCEPVCRNPDDGDITDSCADGAGLVHPDTS